MIKNTITIFALFLFSNIMNTEAIFGDSVVMPGDIEEFPGFGNEDGNLKYYATGEVVIQRPIAIVNGTLTTSDFKFPSSLFIDQADERIIWDLGNTKYEYNSTGTFAYFENSNLCFVNPDVDYEKTLEDYRRLSSSFNGLFRNPGKFNFNFGKGFAGFYNDAFACQTPVSAMVMVDTQDRVSQFHFAQYFPALAPELGTNNPLNTVVKLSGYYDNAPVSQANLTIVDDLCAGALVTGLNICDVFYRSFGYNLEPSLTGTPNGVLVPFFQT